MPELLRVCTQFIEKHGMVDGIYRHTGLQSNIQRLRYCKKLITSKKGLKFKNFHFRNAFDEEKFNEIEQECYINDVHSVSSLLKMYFRELPNPLLTYQLYHKFIVSYFYYLLSYNKLRICFCIELDMFLFYVFDDQY